jgi:hypothetical protein
MEAEMTETSGAGGGAIGTWMKSLMDSGSK